MIRLWNTPSRKKEELKPLQAGKIGLYACGPTVYQRAHIGNFRAYIMEDVLRRVLEHDGFSVKHVMNITDVGHLTDDADEGEDKLEKASAETGSTAREIAEKFTKLFFEDSRRLQILAPTKAPKATEHIKEQIALIEELEKKGFTYNTSDGVYFDTSKFPDYGKFSGQPLEEKEAGARVAANPEKKNPTDFALWKFSPVGSKRQMEWPSPWGVGFPGWHIECSAMAEKYLGQPFDIHAGGVDHIPVHHENEIAQSVAAYGKPLADYWFHVEFLLVDGRKMSKSLGNIFTLDDLEKKGFDPLAVRYFFLGAHYRQKQNFTFDALQAAQNALTKLRVIVQDWEKPKTGCADLEAEFYAALDDDLNTPQALAVLWKMVDSDNPTSAKAETLMAMDKILGLGLEKYVSKPVKIAKDIQELLVQREAARNEKDWVEADKLRDEIAKRGWSVEDTAEGQKAIPKATPSS
ncbi:cysteine--tRNA ligase [Patescibacteria group bacterium]|nr:cysteine--tRNA ligase [Patescibacteria group bacterium]MBU1034174.1 cysteine--tRNA ligase [Patescibacteria group bacterium]MBU1629883.1 cysteine--tRNA ligase [Patescibacteria group bacterium]MBU1907968.1 cysteine--tRNA ligase [Patescibacteria group bacterium]